MAPGSTSGSITCCTTRTRWSILRCKTYTTGVGEVSADQKWAQADSESILVERVIKLILTCSACSAASTCTCIGSTTAGITTLFPTIMEKLWTKPVRMLSKTSVDKFSTFRHRILQGQRASDPLSMRCNPHLFLVCLRPSETDSLL